MSNRPMKSRVEFVVVLAGGLALAAGAGFINSVVLLLGTLPVTHLTGTVSRLSLDLGHGNRADAIFVAGLTLAFVLGAMLSGVIIGASTLRLGRRYGVAVMFEAGLLAMAALAMPRSLTAGALFAATAAGLQNAMASSYRNLIVRTTHVTGLLTDLGFLAGQRITGHKISAWRFGLIGALLAAFVTGGILGVLAHGRMQGDALWIPAGALATAGIVYFAWRILGHRTVKPRKPTARP